MTTRAHKRGLATASAQQRRAFTLAELLVVIVVIGILAALLLPVFSKGKQKAQGASCLNNGRQLMAAMTMYGGDNKESLPPNPDDGNTVPGHNWCSGRAGIGQDEEFDPDVLKDPTLSLLVSYLGGNISVFHCPADLRSGFYEGTDPALIGKTIPAARTFSMNQALGVICPGYDAEWGQHSGEPSLPVNGPWLNNDDNHRRDSPWHTYGSFARIVAPSPSMLWVLLDEDSRGLNDAAFAFGMGRAVWYDAPGTYHNYGCGFAFADGHSETHAWQFKGEKIGRNSAAQNAQDRADWLWMRDRTSANISGVMPPPQ